jgi:hypothetical protein
MLTVLMAAAVTGCGSSGVDSTASSSTSAGEVQSESAAEHSRYVGAAESICRHALDEVHAVGAALATNLAKAATPEAGLTDSLVKPGIKIIARQAARLRALRPRPDSVALETYLGMFDPILALAYQRLEAGDAQDPAQSHEVELLIAALATEQSSAARAFGLRKCSVGFTEALASGA